MFDGSYDTFWHGKEMQTYVNQKVVITFKQDIYFQKLRIGKRREPRSQYKNHELR